jgi:hypothetical protein
MQLIPLSLANALLAVVFSPTGVTKDFSQTMRQKCGLTCSLAR